MQPQVPQPQTPKSPAPPLSCGSTPGQELPSRGLDQASGAQSSLQTFSSIPMYIFLRHLVPGRMHCGPASAGISVPCQHPGPVYQAVPPWGVPPPTERQCNGCLLLALHLYHLTAALRGAGRVLAPSYSSFRERKAEWLQLSGWICGLVWYRWQLPPCAVGSGRGCRAWGFA